MISTWEELSFWQSGEWSYIQERMDEYDRAGVLYNPPRHRIFAAMDAVQPRDVRVVIVGQDPYPSRNLATGIAFSIPEDLDDYPPTLYNIFTELKDDLGWKDIPTHGNLIDWCKQGVFLWNVRPLCLTGTANSLDWEEWDVLNAELMRELSDIAGIFVFLGAKARRLKHFIPVEKKLGWNGPTAREVVPIPGNHVTVLEYSHPSPLGYTKGDHPFKGCRMFSTINSLLVQPIDWRLNDGEVQPIPATPAQTYPPEMFENIIP